MHDWRQTSVSYRFLWISVRYCVLPPNKITEASLLFVMGHWLNHNIVDVPQHPFVVGKFLNGFENADLPIRGRLHCSTMSRSCRIRQLWNKFIIILETSQTGVIVDFENEPNLFKLNLWDKIEFNFIKNQQGMNYFSYSSSFRSSSSEIVFSTMLKVIVASTNLMLPSTHKEILCFVSTQDSQFSVRKDYLNDIAILRCYEWCFAYSKYPCRP